MESVEINGGKNPYKDLCNTLVNEPGLYAAVPVERKRKPDMDN